MFQVAAAVGILTGSVIAAKSFALVMWLTVVPQAACLILAFFVSEPKTSSRNSGNVFGHLQETWKTFWRNKKLRLLTINSVLSFGISESSYEFRSAFVAMVWPVWALGIPKIISSVGATISFWYSGKVIRKFGALKILLFKDVYNRTVNIFSLAIPTILSPLLMATSSFLFGVSHVAEKKLMQEEFSDGQRATMSSLNSLMGSLFYGGVSLVIGSTADKYNPATAMLLAQICLLPTIVIDWRLFSKHRV
jgi:hypothetical protein